MIDPESNRAISQKKYGELLGFDRTTICLNEKIGCMPSLKFIHAVSLATSIPLEYIAQHIIGAYIFDSELKKYLNNEKMKTFLKISIKGEDKVRSSCKQ
ncbi:MAG: hypothetical protein HUU50_13365 [Candidatus Brocadiae bacterium]|nr:hypothetical protein [Candidatus Brocadiia bacterium]